MELSRSTLAGDHLAALGEHWTSKMGIELPLGRFGDRRDATCTVPTLEAELFQAWMKAKPRPISLSTPQRVFDVGELHSESAAPPRQEAIDAIHWFRGARGGLRALLQDPKRRPPVQALSAPWPFVRATYLLRGLEFLEAAAAVQHAHAAHYSSPPGYVDGASLPTPALPSATVLQVPAPREPLSDRLLDLVGTAEGGQILGVGDSELSAALQDVVRDPEIVTWLQGQPL